VFMRRYRWKLPGFSACQKDAPRLNFNMHSIHLQSTG
jgi:hypothetical protein